MKLRPLLAATLLFSAPFAAAHLDDDAPPAPYPEALAHAPRPLPDRIVLTWSGDPSTTQAVTWRTDTSVTRALAEIALANENGRALVGVPLAATTSDFTSDLSEAHYHSVEFTGLQPDALYAYRVGDGVNWSEWFHFRTASRESRPFSFIYFGDAQNDVKTHWSRVFREAFREAPRAAFTLHAGDLVDRANMDAHWGEWFGAPAWVNGTVPVVPVTGNHEYFNEGAGPETERRWNLKSGGNIEVIGIIETLPASNDETPGRSITAHAKDGRRAFLTVDPSDKITSTDAGFTALTGFTFAEVAGTVRTSRPLQDRRAEPGVRTLSYHWQPQFTLPTHGPAGLTESCYYLDYQGARVVVLNSNERLAEQAPWLREVLTVNPQKWTIVSFHHPVFSPAKGRDNPAVRDAWKPILDEFKVDLVLTGHDHTYARSGEIPRSGAFVEENLPTGYQQAYDSEIGTVYVVSVSGPKMYELKESEWAVRTTEDTQLFQVITIEGDELRYEARTAVNRLHDAFTLRKRTGRPNELLETLKK